MRIYKGLDIMYDDEFCVYYAQDFSKPEQPVSEGYPTVEELKDAIDSGKIELR